MIFYFLVILSHPIHATTLLYNRQEVVKQNCFSNPFNLVYVYSAATFAQCPKIF